VCFEVATAGHVHVCEYALGGILTTLHQCLNTWVRPPPPNTPQTHRDPPGAPRLCLLCPLSHMDTANTTGQRQGKGSAGSGEVGTANNSWAYVWLTTPLPTAHFSEAMLMAATLLIWVVAVPSRPRHCPKYQRLDTLVPPSQHPLQTHTTAPLTPPPCTQNPPLSFNPPCLCCDLQMWS